MPRSNLSAQNQFLDGYTQTVPGKNFGNTDTGVSLVEFRIVDMSNTASTQTHPVSWFEIHTADPDRAKAFYGDVFGWTFDDSMPGYSMIDLGDGAPIGGGIAHSGGNFPNDAVFNIQVPDVAAALASIKEHGGSVVADAQSTPYGLSFAYAANPDGSVFGLWCPPAED